MKEEEESATLFLSHQPAIDPDSGALNHPAMIENFILFLFSSIPYPLYILSENITRNRHISPFLLNWQFTYQALLSLFLPVALVS